MRLKTWGFVAALVATFAAGAKTGIEYAKANYVSRDRKFIEGKVVKAKK
jgi:hypothetical protein